VQQVALKQVRVVALGVGGPGPCVRIVDELEARLVFAAERQIPVLAAAKWNVLDRAPEVGAAAGVFEVAVVFLVAQKLVRGRGGFVFDFSPDWPFKPLFGAVFGWSLALGRSRLEQSAAVPWRG